MHSTSEAIQEVGKATERVCKVRIMCTILALDTALNETSVRVSPDLVENSNNVKKNEEIFYGIKRLCRMQKVATFCLRDGGRLLIFPRQERFLGRWLMDDVILMLLVMHRIENAIDTFLEMEKKGIKVDVVVYNALISAFYKVNKFENVHRVLQEMENGDGR
ncbi:hypothetical protein VNO78_06070 [Psophocarpus tetragonolobus]|uniref:Pentatricopeptide repeat-containing protein n=1 Tax=Psophocarpus tetragonolobus TaxID=3891 RepID=A0AAN9SUN0_PSOTE